jgi:Fe-S-cluster containining protein
MSEDKVMIATTENLRVTMEKLTEEQKNAVGMEIFDIVRQMRHHLKKDLTMGPSVAYSIHEEIDKEIKKGLEYGSMKTTCTKGCSFCCRINVDIGYEEAELIIDYCKEIGLDIDWNTLREQQFRTDSSWKTLDPSMKACVFLDKQEGTCRIYEHRPANCRKYYVVTDPKLCDTETNKQVDNVASLFAYRADILTSAIMNITESGNMAKMLLKAKR